MQANNTVGQSMKQSFFCFMCGIIFAQWAWGNPAAKSESFGLRLIVHQDYTIAGRSVKVGDPEPPSPVVICNVKVFLRNCGDKPVTVPTYPEDGHPSALSGHDDESLMFLFSIKQSDGMRIVESPIKFQPVTLKLGETTELPAHRVVVRDALEDRRSVQRSVTFHVTRELADTYGWWNGDLRAVVTFEETEPNKALVPTPMSVTPAAGARVAPAVAAADL